MGGPENGNSSPVNGRRESEVWVWVWVGFRVGSFFFGCIGSVGVICRWSVCWSFSKGAMYCGFCYVLFALILYFSISFFSLSICFFFSFFPLKFVKEMCVFPSSIMQIAFCAHFFKIRPTVTVGKSGTIAAKLGKYVFYLQTFLISSLNYKIVL